MREINVSELRTVAPELKCGEEILLTGTVYTARDAAHKRFFAALDDGKDLPIPIDDCVIYYCGPTPAPNGLAIGSAGPTTSTRMDKFAPRLYDMGMIATIGKGERKPEVSATRRSISAPSAVRAQFVQHPSRNAPLPHTMSLDANP